MSDIGLKYTTEPQQLGNGEEPHKLPVQAMGVPMTSGQYRHFAAVVPGPGLIEPPIDGFVVTEAADVTLVPADDPDAAGVTFSAVPGYEYKLACARVTAVSAGTLVGLWHRKAPAP